MALHVLDENLGGAADREIAVRCREESRVLVTLDAGFGDISRYPPNTTAGIVVLRPERQDKLSIIRLVDRLIEVLGRRPLPGHLWIVTPNRLRIRS